MIKLAVKIVGVALMFTIRPRVSVYFLLLRVCPVLAADWSRDWVCDDHSLTQFPKVWVCGVHVSRSHKSLWQCICSLGCIQLAGVNPEHTSGCVSRLSAECWLYSSWVFPDNYTTLSGLKRVEWVEKSRWLSQTMQMLGVQSSIYKPGDPLNPRVSLWQCPANILWSIHKCEQYSLNISRQCPAWIFLGNLPKMRVFSWQCPAKFLGICCPNQRLFPQLPCSTAPCWISW